MRMTREDLFTVSTVNITKLLNWRFLDFMIVIKLICPISNSVDVDCGNDNL